ncbi:MAG: hypothetical protein Pg6C_04590 [Treponemataceae bacterium]|nr:MAG: hypothetical protein Pg6C_04590 [Treponemataceae bacterium]
MTQKRIFAVLVLAAIVAGGVFAQENGVTIQPYLSFDWDPLFFDPVIGEYYGNYRAFNFDQAGLKITGNLGKITAYVEVAGFPSGSQNYNKYDGLTENNRNYNAPVYYAWGKYQFTETGNIWAGKFKPMFGPALFDWGHFGAGWQQRIAAHTVSGFLLLPGDLPGQFRTAFVNPMISQEVMLHGPIAPDSDNKGLRLMVMDELMTRTFLLTGGALFDYLPQSADDVADASKMYFDVFVTHWGISRLTLTGELAAVVYLQKDGIIKDPDKFSETADAGFGFGIFAQAEYHVIEPLALGVEIKLTDPLVGAARVSLNDGERGDPPNPANNFRMNSFYKDVEGQFGIAYAQVYAKYSPFAGFFIQPGFKLKMANALNDYQPKNAAGDDGSRVGVDFQLRIRWEPSMRLTF